MNNTQTPTYGQVKFASGVNIVLGAWMVIASFVLGYSGTAIAVWNDIIVGVVILILAWSRVANPDRMTAESWINAILGLWLIVAPFVLGFSAVTAAMWNSIIIGVVVAVLGAWSAIATNVAR
jgi:VIT1/CCC1 family predicted Fe2+/Mn2+ transporter